MALNKEPLRLPVDPRSVARARRWVGDVLERLGRDDLVDAAELGVSELVTNALLHAAPPITVQVGGTKDHPRVEVNDSSPRPPEVNVDLAEDEHLLSTIGRGLGIVALYSQTWGSWMDRGGKTVWFEPAADMHAGGEDLSGDVFDFDEVVDERLMSASAGEERIAIRLLDMPVQVFAHFRTRFGELRRELQLLALAHEADYPVARDISELFLQIEQERRQAHGVQELDDAIAAGLHRVDLTYHVPLSTPESMGRMLDMVEKADAFCRDQRLLSLAATPQQRELQRWYLGEFRRQGAGEEPTPWRGSYAVDDAP